MEHHLYLKTHPCVVRFRSLPSRIFQLGRLSFLRVKFYLIFYLGGLPAGAALGFPADA